MFDEQAPCIIYTPFGAANKSDLQSEELCRQTIPHEAAHAIFDQISALRDELKFKIGVGLARGGISERQKVIHLVMLDWLDEVIADMAGTALVGPDFAKSAILNPDTTR